MLLKQKAREENRMIANDVENVHQICLDLKYLTEEELQDSLQNFNSAEKDTHEEVKRIVSSAFHNTINFKNSSILVGCKKCK